MAVSRGGGGQAQGIHKQVCLGVWGGQAQGAYRVVGRGRPADALGGNGVGGDHVAALAAVHVCAFYKIELWEHHACADMWHTVHACAC